MKKILYVFRSNLKNLEYYHDYNDLLLFKNNCHDFYLLQGIWFLENNLFDEVVIWRLYDKPKKDIVFDINGKKIIQRWVKDLNEVFNYEKPTVSFFRGGFKEYDIITKKNYKFFGLKLYLAAGKRLFPQYGGIYDKILIEDEKDSLNSLCIPFYKTTNSNIFKPLNDEPKKFSLCIISNFSQLKYKGTDLIIEAIAKSNQGDNLKICHIGNNEKIGKKIIKDLNRYINITFMGHVERPEVNRILNQSKLGIVASNISDGCPRVITEILTSGTPLLIKDETRVLNYYKEYGVIEFNKNNIINKMYEGFEKYYYLKKDLNDNLKRFDMDIICKLNYDSWK